ncbi:HNH endonuclease [Bacillus sp. FSL K6-0993]|uniref:HNH endonuclease n=1 Tax=Bacillus sp. FSL K6-0993 TaxID=2921456 RepID=UPI0030ED618F
MELSTYRHIKRFLDAGVFIPNTETGQVFSRKGTEFKKCNNSGYKLASGYLDGMIFTTTVHNIIAVAGGLNPVGKTINHIDEDKDNNSLANLEVLSLADNLRQAHKSRKIPTNKGMTYRKRFTDKEVREIRGLLANGLSCRKLSDLFNTSVATISNIKTRKTYQNIA